MMNNIQDLARELEMIEETISQLRFASFDQNPRGTRDLLWSCVRLAHKLAQADTASKPDPRALPRRLFLEMTPHQFDDLVSLIEYSDNATPTWLAGMLAVVPRDIDVSATFEWKEPT